MGINFPPPPVVEFAEKKDRKRSKRDSKVRPSSAGSKTADTSKKRRSSFIGKAVTPEHRTVHANDSRANAVFKYLASSRPCSDSEREVSTIGAAAYSPTNDAVEG